MFLERLKWLLVFLLVTGGICFAQSSVVSGTIVDPGSNVWSEVQIQATFTPAPGVQGPYTWQGGAYNPNPAPIIGDSSGGVSITLPRNDAIVPSGSTWTINICPNATQQCAVINIALTASTTDLEAAINNAAAWPVGKIPATFMSKVYNPTQFGTLPVNQGAIAYDSTTKLPIYFNGTIWQDFAGNGANAIIGNPTTSQTITQPPGTILNLVGNTEFNILNPELSDTQGDSANSVGVPFHLTWTLSTFGQNGQQSQGQIGVPVDCRFQSPSWNFGTSAGNQGVAQWGTSSCFDIFDTIMSRGIGQGITARYTKTAEGDSGFYFYGFGDGGAVDGGHEGTVVGSFQGGQNSTWFQGVVGNGATTGSTALPIVATNPNAFSRQTTSDGGIMLDISLTSAQMHPTGGVSAITGITSVQQQPVDGTLVESTAWGTLNTNIPYPTPVPSTSSSISVDVIVRGGTNSGGYVVGYARLAGALFSEQIHIDSVTTLIGGHQTLTFNHRYPNTAGTSSSIWQGGTHGYASSGFFNNVNGGGSWRTDYYIFGATDSSHIVAGLPTAGGPGPYSFGYNGNSYNAALIGLNSNGTTAVVSSNFNGLIFNGMNGAVLSSCTNSAFNGTVPATITQVPATVSSPSLLSWADTRTGSSANCNISLAPIYNVFQIYQGAEMSAPQDPITGLQPLEPNDVAWSSGHTIEGAFNPAFSGPAFSIGHTVNDPNEDIQNGIGSIAIVESGMGISGQYIPIGLFNGNPDNFYVGNGGILNLGATIVAVGPNGGVLNFSEAPLPGQAMFTIGCAAAIIGGCNYLPDQQMFSLQGGSIKWRPATGAIVPNNLTVDTNQNFPSEVNTGAPGVRSPILSTGPGFTNSNAVAITSANGAVNNLAQLFGEYATLGNETYMDESATLGIGSLYNPFLYVGVLAPDIAHATVASQGTGGSTTYTYACTSTSLNGESLSGGVITFTAGNATLTSVNKNKINCQFGKGAIANNVYRLSGGSTTGKICTNVTNWEIGSTDGSPPFRGCFDTGQTGDSTSPPTNDNTGAILGPITAPSGSCPVAGSWIFTQDGHASYCNAGTWAVKI